MLDGSFFLYHRSYTERQGHLNSTDLPEQADHLFQISHKSLPTLLGTGSEWQLVRLDSDWWIICLIEK